MIKGCEDKKYDQRLVKLGVTSLSDRHYRADMIQVYKVLNDSLNIHPLDFLSKSYSIGRNNSLKLYFKKDAI